MKSLATFHIYFSISNYFYIWYFKYFTCIWQFWVFHYTTLILIFGMIFFPKRRDICGFCYAFLQFTILGDFELYGQAVLVFWHSNFCCPLNDSWLTSHSSLSLTFLLLIMVQMLIWIHVQIQMIFILCENQKLSMMKGMIKRKICSRIAT